MWLHEIPPDLFGRWSGELLLDVDGCAPQHVLFCGDLEAGFQRTGERERATEELNYGPWRHCGTALNREIATRICRVRLASWADMEVDDE